MDATHTGPAGPSKAVPFLRTAALVYGAVFLLVGIAGFIPGITTNYDQLEIAGHESHAKLLGVFQVSVLHNVVHLLFGVVGLAVARKATASAAYLAGGGLVYLLLWVYGLAIGHGSDANFVPLNNADNWLHLVLALTMLGLGFVGYRALRGPVGGQYPA
ncbi:DUF4383 domain-containing protein [Nocardioides sp. Arc9.136]|uniref:DUF4383 domain-containing protein n=1 Tax=Nocardioides sp. Arc9.136 TaxID=2996826 RepID=UPI002666A103|nr:DUF4383 domain-containing protein [Nocardioides sp. Arc9.136]WKN49021.1 DUF4383 domain-containing protein [Nocardioides sp. Arc9.136]